MADRTEPATEAAPKLAIDVVSDVVCPWCFIGVTRLEKAIAEEGGAVDLVFHPFELDPSTPVGGVDLRERLARKYGVDPEAMFGRVEAAARESGIPLDFAKVRRSPNTLKAHTLIGAAKARGIQVEVARAFFEAYFLEGRDLSDDGVLVDVVAARGFDASEAREVLADEGALEATRREAQEAASQGIGGVPFVVFGRRLAVSGAQPVELFRQAIARARNEASA